MAYFSGIEFKTSWLPRDVGYGIPFWKMWQFSGSFSSSTYRPFQGSVPAAYAATGQPTQVTGSLWNVEVMGPIGKTNWSLGYFSCDPRYDPFQALMSWSANVTPPVVFHEIPEFTKYYLHYSMHDVRKFPHNRNGLRVMVQYPFDRGMVFAGYRNLQQREAATLGNITQVGFVEPWFTSLTQVPVAFGGTGGVNVLGRTTKLMLGGGYGFTPRFKGGLMYMSVNHNRATGANLDNIDFLMGIWKVDLDYGFTDKLGGSLGYINGRIEGNYFNPSNAVRNLDMTQSAPYVGLKYGFAKDATVQFRYKFLTQQDGTSPANTGITSFGDFISTLGTAELQFKF